MKINKYIILLMFMFVGTLCFTACGDSNDDNDDITDVEVDDDGGSSGLNNNNLKKKLANALVGTWVNSAEHASWRAYMSQHNTEIASSLMSDAYKFDSNGKGAFLYNRKNNSFTSWGMTESITWTILSCEMYRESYIGYLSLSGAVNDKIEFLMSGDLKQLCIYDEWLDKVTEY